MFKFWQRKEDPDSKLYPSFRARLFSALVDIALSALILIPIFDIASPLVYHDLVPTKRLAKILDRVSKEPNSAVALSNDSEYQKFISDHGYRSIVIEQIIQLSLLASAVFIFWIKKRATPGKMFLSMKIVDYKTLGNPSIFQLIVRLCAYVVSLVPFGFGIFYIVFNKKHRAWHDIISRTLVVNKKSLEERVNTCNGIG
jgi:uncharacterized RDD family membrane protein YckC